MPSSKIFAHGGQGDEDLYEDGCKNGGAGTIYFHTNDTLVVDNGEMNSTAFTIVRVPEGKPLVDDK